MSLCGLLCYGSNISRQYVLQMKNVHYKGISFHNEKRETSPTDVTSSPVVQWVFLVGGEGGGGVCRV